MFLTSPFFCVMPLWNRQARGVCEPFSLGYFSKILRMALNWIFPRLCFIAQPYFSHEHYYYLIYNKAEKSWPKSSDLSQTILNIRQWVCRWVYGGASRAFSITSMCCYNQSKQPNLSLGGRRESMTRNRQIWFIYEHIGS